MHGAAHSARSAQVSPVTGVFPGDPPVLAVRFQQGLDGYAGCADTMLRMATPTTDESATTLLTADLDTDAVAAGNQPAQILVRFGNLFGSAPGQVPLNATIISAKLSLWTGTGASDSSIDLASIHRMLVPWSDSDTWNSLVNGVSADDIEAALANSFTQTPALKNAPVILDVTADIAAFLAGTSNYGWVIQDTGTDGWSAYSSENANSTTRPMLQIAYTIPVAAGYSAWQLAKFGANAGAAGSLPGRRPRRRRHREPSRVHFEREPDPLLHRRTTHRHGRRWNSRLHIHPQRRCNRHHAPRRGDRRSRRDAVVSHRHMDAGHRLERDPRRHGERRCRCRERHRKRGGTAIFSRCRYVALSGFALSASQQEKPRNRETHAKQALPRSGFVEKDDARDCHDRRARCEDYWHRRKRPPRWKRRKNATVPTPTQTPVNAE